MKIIPFLLILLSSWQLTARSFHFPDLDYEYAKIYYFNLGETTSRPDDYIYTKEDGYAESIVGEGKLSTKGLTANIEKLFLYHKDALLNGLSGCYIPRHGIVYFDKNDKPVASLSICFECGAIRMWTMKKGKIKSSDPKATEAGNQLETLKRFLEKEEILVSTDINDYNSLMNTPITINMHFEQLDSTIVSATFSEAKTWFKTKFKEDVDIKYTAGGEKYEFKTLTSGIDTKIIFQDGAPNAKIGEAHITDENIHLPNGIHCGSSLEEVMSTFLVYDGPSNPNVISVEDDHNKIVYTFENQILVLITINK